MNDFKDEQLYLQRRHGDKELSELRSVVIKEESCNKLENQRKYVENQIIQEWKFICFYLFSVKTQLCTIANAAM